MHWCHEQLNWREKYGERAFPGNETVSETWFLPPILVAQCQTEIGEKAKIETPQNNAAVVILDQMVASNCFEKLWLSLLSKKSAREVSNSPDSCWKGKYFISETILSGRLKVVDDSMKNTLNASKTVIWKFIILILPSLVSTQACLTLTLVSNVLRSPWSSLLHHTSPWFSRNAVQMLSHGQYWRGIITLMVIRGPRTLVIWTQQKRGRGGGGVSKRHQRKGPGGQ